MTALADRLAAAVDRANDINMPIQQRALAVEWSMQGRLGTVYRFGNRIGRLWLVGPNLFNARLEYRGERYERDGITWADFQDMRVWCAEVDARQAMLADLERRERAAGIATAGIYRAAE